MGIDDPAGLVENQFRLGQVQVNHAVFVAAGFDGTGENFHILEQSRDLAGKAFGLTLENMVGLIVG